MSIEAISWALNLAPALPPGAAAREPSRTAEGPPSRLEIAAAVPAGSRRPWDPHQWLSAATTEPGLADLRADARRSALEFVRILARHVDWRDKTVWRLREVMCAEIGSPRDPGRPLSVTAWKAARRWWEARGYVGTVRGGWTPELRPMALSGSQPERGLCPVFVLAIPSARLPRRCGGPRTHAVNLAGPVNRPLTDSRRESGKGPRPRETRPDQGQTRHGAGFARTHPVPHGARPGRQPAGQTFSKEEIAALVRHHDRVLGRLSARHWCTIVGKFARSGWTPGDVLHALEHAPGGAAHTWTTPVVHVAGWARWRLGQWCDDRGRPALSPSQRRAAAAELRAERTAAGRRSGVLAPEPRPWDEAELAAPVVDLAARVQQLRAMGPGAHSPWRPAPRPGDPSRWAQRARAQAAESRGARGASPAADAGEALPEPPAVAVPAAGGDVSRVEAARRRRALAQVMASRAARGESQDEWQKRPFASGGADA